MSGVMVPCLKCGELAPKSDGGYCPEHMPKRQDRADPHHHTNAWRKLSRDARTKQPFCLDCGTDDNLSADHLPGAWLKVSLGVHLKITDVEVVCLDCNNSRGSSKPGEPRFRQWLGSDDCRRFLADNPAHRRRLIDLIKDFDPSWQEPGQATTHVPRGVSEENGRGFSRRVWEDPLDDSPPTAPTPPDPTTGAQHG